MREKYIDILNIFSCFAVVMLHHNNIVHSFVPTAEWDYGLINEVLFYFAVPVFLMISGACLFNYRERYSTKVFFKKRVNRILVPYLFWSAVYFVLKCWSLGIVISDLPLKIVVRCIVFCKANPIFYFFPLIFSLYMLMPVFSNFNQKDDRPFLWNLVKIYFVIGAVISPFAKIFNMVFTGCNVASSAAFFAGVLYYLKRKKSVSWRKIFGYALCCAASYIIYYITTLEYNINDVSITLIYAFPIYILLGYLLSTQDIDREYRIIVYLLAVASMFVRWFVMYYLSYKYNVIYYGISNYTYFIAVFSSCALFMWIKYSAFYNKINSDVLQTIASCSFGVFLVHIIIMDYFLHHVAFLSVHWQSIAPFCTYALAVGLIWLYRKSPYAKYLLGG